MGIRIICSEGYALSVCRCTKERHPLEVEPCPGPGSTHSHSGTPRATPRKEGVVCPRCEEEVGSLLGDVCALCAEDLEKAWDVA